MDVQSLARLEVWLDPHGEGLSLFCFSRRKYNDRLLAGREIPLANIPPNI